MYFRVKYNFTVEIFICIKKKKNDLLYKLKINIVCYVIYLNMKFVILFYENIEGITLEEMICINVYQKVVCLRQFVAEDRFIC